MKRIFPALIFLLIISCRSSSNIPAGAPEKIRMGKLEERIEASENHFQNLSIRAVGNFSDKSTSQKFRAQIRILKDSLIWVDIADPLLGIKVARAIVYKDSVAFINRINKQYYTGTAEELQKKIKIDLDFQILQSVFAANVAFDVEDFELYYQPGYYLLSDQKLDEKGNPNPIFGERIIYRVWIDPKFHKPYRQIQENTDTKEVRELEFVNFTPQDEILFPAQIKLTFVRDNEVKLELDIREVEKDIDLNYPFTIPSGYAKMR